MTTEEKKARSAARRAVKQAQTRERMAGVRHALFGTVSVAPVPGTVFDPLACFLDPGFFSALLSFFRWRAQRSGVGSGLPRDHRAAVLDEASQRAMRLFTDRDYASDGVTADERTRAILSTASRMDRGQWRDDIENRRDGDRKWFPWNRAQNTRAPDPSRIVMASRCSREDIDVLTGHGTDEQKTGQTVTVPGGRYQPNADGRMIRDGGRWKMDRRRGKVQAYPACEVAGTVDGINQARWTAASTPANGIPPKPETESGQRVKQSGPWYAADADYYAAQLAEYYAGN